MADGVGHGGRTKDSVQSGDLPEAGGHAQTVHQNGGHAQDQGRAQVPGVLP